MDFGSDELFEIWIDLQQRVFWMATILEMYFEWLSDGVTLPMVLCRTKTSLD